MSNYINENLLDSGYNKKLKDESKALVSKWDRTGLLEGLDGDYNKSSMAILLENQARQLVQEASKTTPDSNISSGQEEWSGVALPLVRRIFAEIAAQEFVSVQPMNLPSGLVFFLDFKYGTSAFGKTSSESVYGKTQDNDIKYGTFDLQKISEQEVNSGYHSPILGWAYDGNPIYGPYVYKEADGGGGLDGDERITIETITAPMIPAILKRLFMLKFQLEYFYSFLIVITRIYSNY